MKKLKDRFDNDPIFAITVIGIGALTAATLLKGTAKMIEASVFAANATKL